MFAFKKGPKEPEIKLPKVSDDELQIFYGLKNYAHRVEMYNAELSKVEKHRKNFQINMANIFCKYAASN